MARTKEEPEQPPAPDPTAVATDQTLIDEAQGAPAPKSKMVTVGAARTATPGEDYVEVWDVAEADKKEHKESKLAGSRVQDLPNDVEDSQPLTVAVDPGFKGDIVKSETGFQVVGG